jgi:hypothetical protein
VKLVDMALCDAAHKKRWHSSASEHWALATCSARMKTSYLTNESSTRKLGKLIILPGGTRNVVVEAQPEGRGFETG